ncbi:hypothetical protein CRENPOLYSF2_2440009 [Crenothrix polyspora]|uniref:Uncharacterized protein n=1 Tax=Crenothrix polyspora TaxID=360316 RepID=A0A1R4H6S8_9GAMM|nr:CotH kinase family protein [Crenothrix polyspora]SJM91944.1 hypothetical protein CRENPOLYSF2_2440009 [Crenothrix polyspora]
MRNKLGSCLILGLAINTLMFSGLAQAVIRVSSLDFKMNNIGVGVETSKNKRVYFPLDVGFSTKKPFDALLTYKRNTLYTVGFGSAKVNNNAKYRFAAIKYGDSVPISFYNKANGKLEDTYTLVFTKLPVIQLTSVTGIPDTPKVQGSFRLVSSEFKQDTGVLNMGIEQIGQVAQLYPKRTYGIGLGTSSSMWQTGKTLKLLDLSEKDSWSLNASYRDTSFGRNRISNDIFMNIHPHNKGLAKGKSASSGRLAEVLLNGSYAGVYLLEEPVDQALLDLKPISVPLTSGKEDWKKVDFKNPQNGSVLYKANFGDTVFFNTTAAQLATNFSQIYPAPANAARPEPLKSLVDFVAKSSDDAFIEGVGSRIDLDNVADWWLLVCATQSIDNFNKNFGLAKNAGGKFFIVPLDHEASFGLAWDGSADPATPFFDASGNNLIKRLTQFSEIGFNSILKDRWLALRENGKTFDKAKVLARFNGYASQLAIGGAKERNLKTWPKSVLPPALANPKAGTSAYISTFLTARLNAMDTYIGGLPE